MKVNGKEIVGIGFAYDGCHKFFVLKNEEEKEEALFYGHEFHKLRWLKRYWEISCPLKFIISWDLSCYYVKQGEQATFEY